MQDQLAAAHDQHHQGEHPDHDVGPRVLTSELLAQVASELGQAVGATLPVRGALAAVPAQSARAAHALEAGHLGVGHLPRALEAPAPGEERGQAHELPEPGAEHRPDLAGPAGEQPDDRSGHRVQEVEDAQADEVEPGRRRQRRAQAVTLGQGQHVEVGAALGQPLPVPRPRVRHHQHPGAGQVRPPAQVQVVAVEVDVRREAAQGTEQVDADQQARRRDAEHVTHRVVLLLVELADLDRVEGHADAVGAETDVLEHARPVPIDQLRPDDAGVRTVGLGHQLADGRRVQRHVVVQEAEEAGALDEPHGLVGRRPEARVVAERPHERPGQALADVGHHARLRAGHQEQQPQVGVVLPVERVQHLVEPGSRARGRPSPPPRRRPASRRSARRRVARPPPGGGSAVGSSIVTVGRG